jgi:hypothetical protein
MSSQRFALESIAGMEPAYSAWEKGRTRLSSSRADHRSRSKLFELRV